jgi:hypothetical protein
MRKQSVAGEGEENKIKVLCSEEVDGISNKKIKNYGQAVPQQHHRLVVEVVVLGHKSL